ncbi:hypothetical protein EDC01DRAFT_14949 [Geopyxis carbonaria]|nr:hypothetical protein EDC01DRAFT_14949 [Geopyxis carbonaria]
MKSIAQLSTLAALLAGTTYAHSWVECVKTEVPDKAKYQANPPDAYSWGPDKEKCHGFPRSVKYRPEGAMTVDPGPWGWNEETLYLSYDVGTLPEKNAEGKTYACPQRQRTPEKTWKDDSGADVEPPVATAKPGESLLMRHWGNGHTTWDPKYANPMRKDPGVVQIYWKPEWDTGSDMMFEDLNDKTWVQGAQGNFSGDAITLYTETPRVQLNAAGYPQMQMIEHANYFTFKLPDDIPEGKHTFIWAWRFLEKGDRKGQAFTTVDPSKYWDEYDIEFTSCFDVEVTKDGDDYAYDGASGTSSKMPTGGDSEPSKKESVSTEKPAAESPAPEVKEEASPSSGGDDICSKPCVRAGVPSYGTCDPAKEKCPACVIPAGGSFNCFESCPASWGGTNCERSSKKVKARHLHNRRHKRGALKF